MTLDLNYSKIINWENLCYVDDPASGERVAHPFNYAMGLALMHTGIQNITRKNAAEFYERIKLVETCVGPTFTNGDGTPRYITPKDVHDYIGLTSNVTPRTNAWFYKHLRESLARDLGWTYRRYADEQERETKARIMATVAADPTLSKLASDE